MSEQQQPDANATGAYDASAPVPVERFAPGAVLAGRYRVIAALGRGGMGEVWRADDLALGAVGMLIPRLGSLAAEWVGLPPPPPLTGAGPDALRIPGPPTPLYVLLTNLAIPIIIPIMWLLLSFLFFLVLRWERLAWLATWLLLVAVFTVPFLGPNLAGNALMVFGTALLIGLRLFVLARFGLLAFAGLLFCDGQLSLAPLTADLSAWYAYQGILVALVVIGLAAYGFVTATRGQRLFREGFFGDE